MTREQPASAPKKTLVLLCEDLRSTLDTDTLTEDLLEDSALSVEVVSGLCTHPAEVARVSEAGAERLVLATCRPVRGDLEWELRMRECGVDPLATGFVQIDGSTAERALVLLRAGIARARAAPETDVGAVVPRLASFEGRVSRRGLFTVPPLRYQPVVTIDAGACAVASGCRLCTTVCPINALTITSGAVALDRARCEACGICAAECPTNAITIPGDTPEQLTAEVAALLGATSEAETQTRAVLFRGRCSRAQPATMSDGWLAVDVPCGGALTPAVLLGSLALGASEVGVAACEEDCRFDGGDRAQAAVRYCRDLLDALALPPERVRLVTSGDHIDGAASPLTPVGAAAPDVLHSAASAVVALADATGIPELEAFSHLDSPLGLVDIDAASCTVCGACAWGCPTGALAFREDGGSSALTFDATACTGCALCVARCPEFARGAIAVAPVTDIEALRAGRRPLIEDATVHCEQCGKPVGPAKMLARLEERLGPSASSALLTAITRRCVTCRGLGVPAPGGLRN